LNLERGNISDKGIGAGKASITHQFKDSGEMVLRLFLALIQVLHEAFSNLAPLQIRLFVQPHIAMMTKYLPLSTHKANSQPDE
jgi:hypothetical protein